MMKKFILTVFGTVALISSAFAQPPVEKSHGVKSPGEKVHLADLAKRIFYHRNADRFTLFLHTNFQFKVGERIVAPPKPRSLFDFMVASNLQRHPWIEAPWMMQKPETQRLPWEPTRIVAEAHPDDLAKSEIVKALARVSDNEGWVDLNQLKTYVGDGLTKSLLDEILLDDGPIDTRDLSTDRLLGNLDADTRDKIVKRESQHAFAHHREQMPALNWISRRWNSKGDALKSIHLFAQQHLLGNTAAMLIESGIEGTKSKLWGKSYSLEPKTSLGLSQLGFTIAGHELGRDRREIESHIDELVRSIRNPHAITSPKFVILDDGGELLEIVANHVREHHADVAHLFAGVEQTTKGLKRLNQIELPFAVVNVAGSLAKTRYGSPMFGYAIAKQTKNIVDDYMRVTHDRLHTTVVMGFGNIGSSVARAMREQGFHVVVYDTDAEKLQAAAREGFTVARTKKEALNQAQVLISTVGNVNQHTLTTEDLVELPVRAVVVNGASKDEFKLEEADMYQLMNSSPNMDKALGPHHRYYTFRANSPFNSDLVTYNIMTSREASASIRVGGSKQIYVANGGGVINFPRTEGNSFGGSAVPERYIQLDVGLLYLGLLQAKQGGKPGLVDLDSQRQTELIQFVEGNLKSRGESLLNPRW